MLRLRHTLRNRIHREDNQRTQDGNSCSSPVAAESTGAGCPHRWISNGFYINPQ